jgi:hypothetical protein
LQNGKIAVSSDGRGGGGAVVHPVGQDSNPIRPWFLKRKSPHSFGVGNFLDRVSVSFFLMKTISDIYNILTIYIGNP